MPYGSGNDYYEAGNMQENSMGRKKPKKVMKGGAGTRSRPKLGSGMVERAASAIEQRRRMLRGM